MENNFKRRKKKFRSILFSLCHTLYLFEETKKNIFLNVLISLKNYIIRVKQNKIKIVISIN